MLLIVHSTTECLVGWLTCAIRQLTRLVSIWNYIRADLRFCRIKFNFFVCLRFVAPLGCNSAQQMCFLSVCVCVWLCLFCSRNWHRQKHMVIHIQWVCVCVLNVNVWRYVLSVLCMCLWRSMAPLFAVDTANDMNICRCCAAVWCVREQWRVAFSVSIPIVKGNVWHWMPSNHAYLEMFIVYS